MNRRTSLQRKKPLTRSTPLKKVSAKTAAERKAYKPIRDKYLEDHPECELQLEGCTFIATDVHHSEKRGKNYMKVEKLQSCCRNCHNQKH